MARTINGTNDDDNLPGTNPGDADNPDGIDIINGLDGNDRIFGWDGDDIIQGGAGIDDLHGGNGIDTLSYVDSASGVEVVINSYGASGDAYGDAMREFENLRGSAHSDRLVGDDGANVIEGADGDDDLQGAGGDDTLIGGAGNDILSGGGGADALDGGEGTDAASYNGSAAGVTVNLLTGTGSGGDAEGDTLSGIENLTGSAAHGDSLTGDNNANQLFGQGGDDTLSGEGGADRLDGGAGADAIDGGDGNDTLIFSGASAGVVVDLSLGQGLAGDALGDTYTSIEAVDGTSFNDTLTGNLEVGTSLFGSVGDDTLNGGNANDLLSGDETDSVVLAGVDILNGGAGDDTLIGGGLGDTLNGGAGSDTAAYNAPAGLGISINLLTGIGRGGDAEGDTLISIETIDATNLADRLVGDGANNTFWANGGDDLLMGGGGADYLFGDAGIDTALYRDSPAAVIVSLLTGRGSGGDAEGDSLYDIENLSGSAAYGDTLTGDAGTNRLDGLGGDDTLNGEGGDDTLLGGDGADTLNGGDGVDQLLGHAGNDILDGGNGADRLQGGDGDDVLTGGAGIDQLYGGAGADLFAFATVDGSMDRIRDWEAGDRIQIDQDGFGIAGAWDVVNGTSTHGLTGDVFFYHTTTGRLFFHDGDTGIRSLVAVITADPATLSQSDFVLV